MGKSSMGNRRFGKMYDLAYQVSNGSVQMETAKSDAGLKVSN